MSDLFDAASSEASSDDLLAPLAVRMRPRHLDEVVGQRDVLRPGSPLRRLVEGQSGLAGPISAILFGPPGTGKTTLAHLVASAADREFVELSAVTAGVKDVRDVLAHARRQRTMHHRQTVLFLDEIHRFSKAQQDALLPAVENREVVLVAATTENPSFSIISPLLSRSVLVALGPLDADDLTTVLDRAITDDRGLAGHYALADDARDHVIAMAGGDARRALTILEAAAGVSEDHTSSSAGTAAERPITIALADVELAVDRAAVRYDRAGDQHYDVASAFIKSMRGSDVDAALHYLARQLEAGEDPRFIARRIVIAASEEVGLADPNALLSATAALQAVSTIGMPEGRLALAQAVVHVCLAPKSNAVYAAINAAVADVRAGRGGPVPQSLRGSGYAGAAKLGHGEGYRYTHDQPNAVGPQQFLPDDLVDADYYHPTGRGWEASLTERWEHLRSIIRGGDGGQ